jgi:hypothetical protein
MTFEADLYAALSGAAGLTALVGTEIHPSHAIDGVSSRTYIVYTPVTAEPLYSLAGAGTMTRVRLQVDCYAEDQDMCMNVALAVVDAIPQTGALCRGAHSNQDFGLDEEVRLFRRIVEFSIFHRST